MPTDIVRSSSVRTVGCGMKDLGSIIDSGNFILDLTLDIGAQANGPGRETNHTVPRPRMREAVTTTDSTSL